MGCSALAACATSPEAGTTTAVAETPKIEVKFDQAKAWEALVKQCDFGPRMPTTTPHLHCRDWIVEQMKLSCDDVRTQELSHTWSRTNSKVTMWNIIGEQNWKDAKTRVLLIAHWDTRPYADQDPDFAASRKPILGANDGASGVAVLLELMRSLKGRLPKDVGVQYLMTDGEDLGPGLEEMFLGAVYYAKHLPTPKPDYGILLDMIGDKDLHVPIEPNSLELAPSLSKALYAHAKTVGLESTFPDKLGPTIEDDHLCINQAGIPTVDFIDFDYPSWHTSHDTVDKCSAESLGKMGKFLETWLLQEKPFKIGG